MQYPYILINGRSGRDEDPARVYLHIQSEYIDVDEEALAQAVREWLVANVTDIVSTDAARHEQVFPVTPLPTSTSE